MMLDRQGGNIWFECDTCPETLDTGTSDFDSARNLLRREGWRTSKVGTEWVHACSNCSEAHKDNR